MILHRSTYVYLFQIAVLGAIFQEQVNKVVAIESDESVSFREDVKRMHYHIKGNNFVFFPFVVFLLFISINKKLHIY